MQKAVAKARAERERAIASAGAAAPPAKPVVRATGGIGGPAAAPSAASEASEIAATPDGAWAALEAIELDPRHLERNRIVTYDRSDPAHATFDMLRTRILSAFAKHGWSRVGITSPTKACGKTFVASNLALSLARQKDCRSILMDLDLRKPGLAKTLGVEGVDPIKWFLSGEATAQSFLRRVGGNLALGLGESKTANPAETLLAPAAATALNGMRASLDPDVVIYDLPPMLVCDDVVGFLPQLDCVLLVVGGATTRPSDVTECEHLLADQTNLLGVILNRGEGASGARYDY